MNTRTGFASCAVVLLLAVANVAAAQQSRERRQERRTEPSQPEPTVTTLSEQTFEQTDGLHWVRHMVTESGAEACQIVMGNRQAKTAFVIQTNASDRTFVVVRNYSDPLPPQFTRPERETGPPPGSRRRGAELQRHHRPAQSGWLGIGGNHGPARRPAPFAIRGEPPQRLRDQGGRWRADQIHRPAARRRRFLRVRTQHPSWEGG